MRPQRAIALVTCMLLLAGPGAGCASNSGRSYTPSEARTAQTVRTGTITHIGQAVIEEDSSLLGPIVGGVAGGVVGSLFGSGAGKVLTTLGGAGAGALAGAATEKTARTDKALEITIELDNGQTISVVQVDDDVFTVGDKVRVVYGAGGKARVQHF